MNIYFVNKKSNIKGPFDITSASRHKIINVGDVIIRDTDSGITFLLVISDTNRWSACKCISKVCGDIDLEANTQLFSFDGLNARFGDIKSISRMIEIFKDSPLKEFFENALSILEYKCDFWNVEVFYKINMESPIQPEQSNNKPIIESDKRKQLYLFETFLSQDALLLFQSLQKETLTLKDVYKEVRKRYPNEFRQALKVFLQNHPNSTIYDKI